MLLVEKIVSVCDIFGFVFITFSCLDLSIITEIGI